MILYGCFSFFVCVGFTSQAGVDVTMTNISIDGELSLEVNVCHYNIHTHTLSYGYRFLACRVLC